MKDATTVPPAGAAAAVDADLAALLLCLRRQPAPSGQEHLRSLTGQQWQAVANLAQRYGIAQMLYHRLNVIEKYNVNEDTLEELRLLCLGTAARNLVLQQELAVILQQLHSACVPAILLKGAFLAECVYDHIGLRSMTDVDLLIRPGDVEPAIATLAGMGFIAERPYRQDVDGMLHYHAPVMEKRGVVVELHWNLTRESNLASIDTEGLWRRSRIFRYNGIETRALGSNDLLLHLAVHIAYGHRFHYQLRSLVDLDEAVWKNAADLDWASIAGTCRQWGAERGAYLAFRLAAELLGTPVPATALAQLKPAGWEEQAFTWARANLFRINPTLSENYIRMMHSRRLSERLGALARGLFPPRQIMAMEYGVAPDSLRILALYPGHIASRIAKYWKHARRLITGDRLQAEESQSDQSLRDWLGVGKDHL